MCAWHRISNCVLPINIRTPPSRLLKQRIYPRHFSQIWKQQMISDVAAVAASAITCWHVIAVQSIEPNNFISTISILIFCPFKCCFRFFSMFFPPIFVFISLLINRRRFKFQILKINKMNWLWQQKLRRRRWREAIKRERKSSAYRARPYHGRRAADVLTKKQTSEEQKSRSKIHA